VHLEVRLELLRHFPFLPRFMERTGKPNQKSAQISHFIYGLPI